MTVGEMLGRNGVSRRGFIKFCTASASAMALPAWMGAAMAEQLRHAPRPSVVYLSFQECTGCFESFTRSFSPTIETPLGPARVESGRHKTAGAQTASESRRRLGLRCT